jgi:Fe-S-cluster containining protein
LIVADQMKQDSDSPIPADNPIGFMRAPTPQLRTLIAQQREVLPAADFAEMVGYIRTLFAKYATALIAARSGAERGRALHRMMDSAIATAASVPVSCRSGCCGCCHSEVEVTRDEASVLKERVLGGVEIDRSRLQQQAARERLSPAWKNFWSPENRCIFLSTEGTCRIYEDRPAACRRLLVTTPAEGCTTAGAAIAPVRILLAEVLLSAAVSVDTEAFGSLSRMLQLELQEPGEPRPPSG